MIDHKQKMDDGEGLCADISARNEVNLKYDRSTLKQIKTLEAKVFLLEGAADSASVAIEEITRRLKEIEWG